MQAGPARGEARDGVTEHAMVVGEIGARVNRAAEQIADAEALRDDVGGSDAEELRPDDDRIGIVGGVAAIASGLADGGKNLACHPLPEAFGLGLPTREDEALQPGLVDREQFTRASCRTNTSRTSLIFIEPVDGFARVADVENVAYILGYEPSLTVLDDGAHEARVEREFDGQVLRVCGRIGHIRKT